MFGGSGFLGRRIVRHLRRQGFAVRIAARRPPRAAADDAGLRWLQTDIREAGSVERALVGMAAAVNAVSLYVEHGRDTFQAIHVEAAQRLAVQARRAGLERLVHVSGIGSDAASESLYVRKRGEGEHVVRQAFPDAVIVRPAVMFGRDDAFLTALLGLVRLPVQPLFGDGRTRLQPSHVGDVAMAIANILHRPAAGPRLFECAGPQVYAYRALLGVVARAAGTRPRLLPVPFALWRAIAWCAEWLPSPPITRNQVELMQIDTVQAAGVPGFAELGIAPRSIEQLLATVAKRS